MKRIAFTMSVYSGAEEEYKRRHNPIWPELELELKKHGVRHYSIFLDRETNRLFGYAEIEDEEIWQAIAQTNICKKWWLHMKEIMPSNPDNSPVSTKLEEVFRLG